jgi:hypothetical protein
MKRKALLKRIKISGIFEIGFTPSVGTVADWLNIDFGLKLDSKV